MCSLMSIMMYAGKMIYSVWQFQKNLVGLGLIANNFFLLWKNFAEVLAVCV